MTTQTKTESSPQWGIAPNAAEAAERTPPLARDRTLFQLEGDYLAFYQLLDETQGEVRPEDEAAFDAWMAEFHNGQAVKADGYLNLIDQRDADAAMQQTMIDKLMERVEQHREAKRLILEGSKGSVKYFKRRLMEFMQSTSQKKIKTQSGRTITLAENGGKLPIVPSTWATDVDPATLPDALCIVERRVDPEAVRAELEAGAELPFCSLGERGQHVRVK